MKPILATLRRAYLEAFLRAVEKRAPATIAASSAHAEVVNARAHEQTAWQAADADYWVGRAALAVALAVAALVYSGIIRL